jgi:hypothetical protein
MSALEWIAVALLTVSVVFAACSLYGHRRWRRLTEALHARLDAAATPVAPLRMDAAALLDLPPPVQRYLRAALPAEPREVAVVEIEHRGSFNLGSDRERWAPFRSRQRVRIARPGFVWDARVRVAPGVAVHVHDAYAGGEGTLHAALLGAFDLADLQGGGAIAEGEAMRYLAEAAWYPVALLPGRGVRWEAIDDRSARATLGDGGIATRLVFVFGDDDLIVSVRADARGRTVGDAIVPTPWEGRWSDYRVIEGMRVPMRGEVAWLLPERRLPYWRGELLALRLEDAP